MAKNYSKYAWLLFQHCPHKGTLTIQCQEGGMHILNSVCFLLFFIQFLSWFLANQQLSVCVCVCVCVLRHVRFSATPWPIAYQSPLSMEFSRQEYWSGLPFPSPGNLNPGIKPTPLISPVLAGKFFTSWTNSARILFCGNISGRQGPGSYSFTNS